MRAIVLGVVFSVGLLWTVGCKRSTPAAPAAAKEAAPAPATPAEIRTDDVARQLKGVGNELQQTAERLQNQARTAMQESSEALDQRSEELSALREQGEALFAQWMDATAERREALKTRIEAFVADARKQLDGVVEDGGARKDIYLTIARTKLDHAALKLQAWKAGGQVAAADLSGDLQTKWAAARDQLKVVQSRAADDWVAARRAADEAIQELEDAIQRAEPAPEHGQEP